MSLQTFQAALALLIRCPLPERSPKVLEAALSGNLTDEELHSVKILSQDDEFNKYGREQREMRWKSTYEKLQYLSEVIPEEELYDLWLHDFDPEQTHLESDLSSCAATASRSFIAFLSSDAKIRKLLTENFSESTVDLLKFLDAQIELAQYIVRSPELNPGTLLKEPHLRIIDLDYDMISFCEVVAELKPEDPLPYAEKRPTLVLMVRTSGGEFPKVFEIDEALAAYIRSQQHSQGATKIEVTEELRRDLKVMGLL